MTERTTCPNCGDLFRGDSTAGACPRCLMAMAMPADSGRNETTARDGFFYAPRPDEIAKNFPNLEIIELLGHGGMGAVYRARQINLDRVVALKVLSPRLGGDPSFAERFTREARTLAKLTHPSIVTVFDFGQAGSLYFLVMELVEGVNLRDAIETHSVTAEQALQIVPQVCEALQYAHDHGVVHRDIKPENILIGHGNRVKIADFGLAKMLSAEPANFTLTGTHQVLGTRNYMAPEQIEKPMTVDHRADIYSLGVVFYELLTGELPLGRFAVPSEKAATGNQQLDDVVLKTLEKEPGRRFQQASQVKTAVEAIDLDRESPLPNTPPPKPPVMDKPHKSSEPVDRNRTSIPFKIDSVHGGFSEAHGIAHFDGSWLEFEFRTHLLGLRKSKTHVVHIPASKILRATIAHGIFADSIELQSEHLETFDEVPGSIQGKIKLATEKKNSRLTEEFASRVTAAVAAGLTSDPRHDDHDNRQYDSLAHVPFKIPDVHGGVNEAFGIAKVNQGGLIIEFELKDALGITKSSPTTVRIPIRDIVDVRFSSAVFSDKIAIQTAGLDAVSSIPTSMQGRFVIRTKKGDRHMAQEFVCRLADLGGLPAPFSGANAKPLSSEQQEAMALKSRLYWPARALFAVAIVNLLSFCIGASLVLLHNVPWMQNENESMVATMLSNVRPLSFLFDWLDWLPQLSNATAIPTLMVTGGMAILLIFAAANLDKLNKYHFVTAASILAALPIHSGFVFGLPIGIWTLVVLLDPNSKSLFEANRNGQNGPYEAFGRRYDHQAVRKFCAVLFAATLLATLIATGVITSKFGGATDNIDPSTPVQPSQPENQNDRDNENETAPPPNGSEKSLQQKQSPQIGESDSRDNQDRSDH